MVAGSEFHSFGAQIENALSPYVAVLILAREDPLLLLGIKKKILIG